MPSRAVWPSAAQSWAGTALGALLVATSGMWISLSGTSPGTASAYRCALALPLLIPLAVWERRRAGAPYRPGARTIAAGVLFSADMLLWTQAMAEVGVGLTAVIVNLQVVMVPALAWFFRREPVPRRFLLVLPVALTGVVLTSGVLGGGSVGSAPVSGTAHAALAALCYSGFLFLLRSEGGRGRTIRSYTAMMALAVVVSALLGTVWHGFDLAPGWSAAGWLLLAAVCGQVLGWLLVALCLAQIPSHVGAVLLLLTPVGALILGGVVLGERPAALQLLGSALLCASVVVTRRGAEKERPR